MWLSSYCQIAQCQQQVKKKPLPSESNESIFHLDYFCLWSCRPEAPGHPEVPIRTMHVPVYKNFGLLFIDLAVLSKEIAAMQSSNGCHPGMAISSISKHTSFYFIFEGMRFFNTSFFSYVFLMQSTFYHAVTFTVTLLLCSSANIVSRSLEQKQLMLIIYILVSCLWPYWWHLFIYLFICLANYILWELRPK